MVPVPASTAVNKKHYCCCCCQHKASDERTTAAAMGTGGKNPFQLVTYTINKYFCGCEH